MPHAALEIRLAALEREVEQLKRRVGGPIPVSPPSRDVDVAALVHTLASRGLLVPDAAGLMAHLRLHPDLLELLEDAVREAQVHLPGGTELSLERYRDPETADEYLTLYARHADDEANL